MNIFDLFKKSPDYDPNLSWDKILKCWEEHFLGSGQSLESNATFNYELESDTSFDNSLNKCNPMKILYALFDQTLDYGPSKNPFGDFTCVNKDCMKRFSVYGGAKNRWRIPQTADCLSKPFLRFVLKKNLTSLDVQNLLYLLSDCKVEIIIGGQVVLSIEKLLFILIICEKLSNPVKIFDAKKFLESNSMEDIKNMICKTTENGVWINQKYYISDNNSIYLDIPLLIDFFSYNISTILIALQYHDVEYNFIIPDNKIDMISKYIDDIVIMFEEIGIFSNSTRHNLASNSFEFIKMTSKLDYYHCWTGNYMEFSDYDRSKFIFIIVRPSETNNFDSGLLNNIDVDFDITQLPQIINVELEEKYSQKTNGSYVTNFYNKTSSVDLENIWVGQFNSIVIYGIASDGISSMKDWIKVNQECINSVEKLSFKNNTNNNNKNLFDNNYTSNFNPTNTQELYKIVDLNNIKITWSESVIPSNIEIIHIQQNVQRITHGMSGQIFGC